MNNLKQIALAMHNYHAVEQRVPAPAIMDGKGKPLLSWRVAILPYIEQQELYDKFKLDEPWDSPHNKALLKEMPAIYMCPSRTKAEPFTTNYRVFVGNGALFEKDQDIGVADVTDGTARTRSCSWKPRRPSPGPSPTTWRSIRPRPLARSAPARLIPAAFNASMANGSVRFLKNTIDLNVFRALITRAAGEAVQAGSF